MCHTGSDRGATLMERMMTKKTHAEKAAEHLDQALRHMAEMRDELVKARREIVKEREEESGEV